LRAPAAATRPPPTGDLAVHPVTDNYRVGPQYSRMPWQDTERVAKCCITVGEDPVIRELGGLLVRGLRSKHVAL
jgi:hypothetical protein